MNTLEIIQRCLRREEAAEKELYYAYAKMVFGICRRYSVDDAQAKDYMQDSFEKIFSNLNKFDPQKGVFNAWISRIVINTIYSDKRKKKRLPIQEVINDNQLVHLIDYQNDINDFIGSEITQKELLTAIRKLPPAYQEVLNLAFFDNWKHKEIADFLGIAESSSRSKLTRAKKLLKSILISNLSKRYERKLG